MHKKKIIAAFAAWMLAACASMPLAMPVPAAAATTQEELDSAKKDLKSRQKELGALQAEITQTEKELNGAKRTITSNNSMIADSLEKKEENIGKIQEDSEKQIREDGGKLVASALLMPILQPAVNLSGHVEEYQDAVGKEEQRHMKVEQEKTQANTELEQKVAQLEETLAGQKEQEGQLSAKVNEAQEKVDSLDKKLKEEKAEEEALAKKMAARKQVKGEYTYDGKAYTYNQSDLELIYAIVCQESNSSYDGALAVITCACNRAASSKWKQNGSDPLSQLTARGQFCYSIDSYWKKYLNGNVPSHVKKAVDDGLAGKRNHEYLSFRGYPVNGGGLKIGGNYYFSHM